MTGMGVIGTGVIGLGVTGGAGVTGMGVIGTGVFGLGVTGIGVIGTGVTGGAGVGGAGVGSTSSAAVGLVEHVILLVQRPGTPTGALAVFTYVPETHLSASYLFGRGYGNANVSWAPFASVATAEVARLISPGQVVAPWKACPPRQLQSCSRSSMSVPPGFTPIMEMDVTCGAPSTTAFGENVADPLLASQTRS